MTRELSAAVLAWTLLTCGAYGCAPRSVPDPQEAVQSYVTAAKAGDARTLHSLLSEDAKREHGEAEVRALVASSKAELAEFAGTLATDTRTTAEATLTYADGETVALTFERGAFRVAGAGAMPSGARTPDRALDELRRVLARRSYAGLLRVVTPRTREAIEKDLRSLVRGLERPETLPIRVDGDSADVNVPGGHHVRLTRQSGVWRVDDFD
ncbi:MAG: hypothetical protein U0169_18890 [Polyangiaceae bacterium]